MRRRSRIRGCFEGGEGGGEEKRKEGRQEKKKGKTKEAMPSVFLLMLYGGNFIIKTKEKIFVCFKFLFIAKKKLDLSQEILPFDTLILHFSAGAPPLDPARGGRSPPFEPLHCGGGPGAQTPPPTPPSAGSTRVPSRAPG